MNNLSFENITSDLSKNGFSIHKFRASTTGNYSQVDADWNYKDIAHIHNVHSQIDKNIPVAIGKKTASYINIQKIPFLGISIPSTIVHYEHSKFNQVHFASFGPMIVIIDIKILSEGKDTIVNTEYAIAAKGIFKLFFKPLEKIVLRNYKILLKEDTSMRNQRAELRNAGHDFQMHGETYDYDDTLKINKNNVVLIEGAESKISVSIKEIIEKKPNKIGTKKGLLSFFLTYTDKIRIWPSTCPHEGANITKSCILNEIIICPWHGRRLKPIIELSYDNEIALVDNEIYKIDKNQDNLDIIFNK